LKKKLSLKIKINKRLNSKLNQRQIPALLCSKMLITIYNLIKSIYYIIHLIHIEKIKNIQNQIKKNKNGKVLILIES
jgi:IS30 family transposase